MLYPYMTLPDETEIVHSEILKEGDKEQVKVYIERPVEGGFAMATCWLPEYRWENIKGFSEADIAYFSDIIHSGAHLFLSLPGMEGSLMPQLFKIGSYLVFIWVNEGKPLEPVHVHIAEKNPTKNATKVWITSSGKCLLANIISNIPEIALRNIVRIIETRSADIIAKWQELFGQVTFYC